MIQEDNCLSSLLKSKSLSIEDKLVVLSLLGLLVLVVRGVGGLDSFILFIANFLVTKVVVDTFRYLAREISVVVIDLRYPAL